MTSLPRRSIYRSSSHGTQNLSQGSPSGNHARSSSIGDTSHSFQSQPQASHIRDQNSPSSDIRLISTSPASVDGVSQADLEDDLAGVEPSSDSSSEDEEFDKACLPVVGGDSSDSSDAEMIDAQDRKRIRPRGKTFKDSREVMQIATGIMHSHYEGQWTSWTMVPDDVKCFWWKRFEKVYFWKDRHAQKVRKNWRRKCSQHLRSSFKDGRRFKKKPKFVNEVDWVAMLEIWKSDDAYKKISTTNRKNRASEGRFGKGTYAVGSKSSVQVASEFKKRHKRKMTQEELMKATFRKKKTKEWTGPGPKNIIRTYQRLYAEYSDSHPEGVSEEEKNMLWCKAAGGDYKGRLAYQGSLHYSGKDFRNPAALVPSPSPDEQNAHIASLRTEVLQEKQRHQSETAQLHQTYAAQIQRLVEMQRTNHQHHQAPLAPHYLPMQAPYGHQYMQQQPSFGHQYVQQQAPMINPTYTSLLLGSTTNGFAPPLFGGLAPDGPIASTSNLSTPYTIQAGNTPYVSRTPSFNPSMYLNPTATDVGENFSLFDHSIPPPQRPHIGFEVSTNANNDGAATSYDRQNIHLG